MSINKIVIESLNEFGYPIAQDIYTGSDDIYFVWNVADDRGVIFCDDVSVSDVISIQIHLYVPDSFNYLGIKKKIRKALIDNGFSYPQFNAFFDEETKKRHLVFSCEINLESESI